MEIILLILKIIGMSLLVLLGICLFLLGSVIFIPVRYRINGKGDVSNKLEIDAVFHWFLHIIHAKIHYNTEGFQLKIRILGIPLHLGKEKKPKKKTKNIKIKKTKQQKSTNQTKEVEIHEIEENSDVSQKTEVNTEKSSDAQQNDISQNEIVDSAGKEELPKQKKEHWWKKLSISKIKKSCKRFWEKLKQIKNQLTNIKSIISAETNRNAVAVLFQELKYVLKHYVPRKASGELLFGTDDPANTGEILGVISMLPFWYRYKISVIPDFSAEAFYAKGDISLKGYMRSVHILSSGIRLIKNKDIRKLFNQIRG